MAERPIIFSAEMVRAILDGRKTQTRRVVTRNNSYYDGGSWPKKDFAFIRGGHDENRWDEAFTDSGPSPSGNPGPYLHLPVDHFDTMMQKHDRTVHRIYSRIWIDDLLWVKETWALFMGHVVYYADGDEKFNNSRGLLKIGKWKPSIFMPKKAARLWLKVKDVRVERVQDISVEDVLDEGTPDTGKYDYDPVDETRWRCEFSDLWDSINKKRGFGWEMNPFVWVIEFERCTT